MNLPRKEWGDQRELVGQPRTDSDARAHWPLFLTLKTEVQSEL